MKAKTDSVAILNLFFIFLSIIRQPLQLAYLPFDNRGRILFLLSIVCVVLSYNSFRKYKQIFQSWPFRLWTMLVLFSWFNTIVKGFNYEFGAIAYFRHEFVDMYIFLVITMVELCKDKSRCLKVILVAQAVYVFICLANGMIQGNEDRFGMEGIGNLLPLTVFSSSVVVSVLYVEKRFKANSLEFYAIMSLFLLVLLLSQSRKAFAAVLVVVIGIVLSKVQKVSFRSIVVLLLSSVVLYLGVSQIMESSAIGERFDKELDASYYAQIFDNPVVNDFANSFLGDRAIQYFYAIESFTNHPLTGIGLNNYEHLSYNLIALNLHSEYMTQLCENGLVGIVLSLLMYILIFRGLNQQHKRGQNISVFVFGFLALLFVNFTAWTYNTYFTMVIYAILFTQISYYNTYEVSYTSPRRKLQ